MSSVSIEREYLKPMVIRLARRCCGQICWWYIALVRGRSAWGGKTNAGDIDRWREIYLNDNMSEMKEILRRQQEFRYVSWNA